jgi:hypothetical protein
MLVALGEPPEVVFAAATWEALRHSGSGSTRQDDPVRARRNGQAPRQRRQASEPEHAHRVGATPQNIRSRAPWTTILADRQDAQIESSLLLLSSS